MVLVLVSTGFSQGTPVFPSLQKPTFPNPNSIWKLRATGLSVVTDCISVIIVKKKFICLLINVLRPNKRCACIEEAPIRRGVRDYQW